MTFLNLADIESFYQTYQQRVTFARQMLNRPLTFAEKILYAHMPFWEGQVQRGKDTISVTVDRVAMQDATAQMAMLQFMLTGRKAVAVPATIHCDHLIQAAVNASEDLQHALRENNEVYQFLRSAANKYGIGFWNPGSGIIHQVVLEKYAVPGQLMIGTDSHTPNAGGLGMMAIGVGGNDAVDVLGGELWSTPLPKLIGIKLTGKLNGWTSPKDIILKVAQILTVKGGTGYIIEYFGEGAASISATGKATITNMGAEVGATTSLFPYDQRTAAYLRATERGKIAEIADRLYPELNADKEVQQNPLAYFDQYIEIDLSQLQPHVVGPHTPDLAREVGLLGKETQEKNWPLPLHAALIGSCTNSSYEDMRRAASIATQAIEHGAKAQCSFLITPGSEQIYRTMQREGLIEVFEQIGGVVLANACGPCIGQWKRSDTTHGQKNSIISSYNRNFKERNDANPETHAFIASPEIVTAYALAGRLDFNPLVDKLKGVQSLFTLQAPTAPELPEQGFVIDDSGYERPSGQGEVVMSSERLAPLTPFTQWKENDFTNLVVLLKAQGKCTTDHISPAGKWLRYRGHLDKISDNMFCGAVNAFTKEVGKGKNVLTGEIDSFSMLAREYKQQRQGWVVIGDTNYGEGSSREHAAMEPRYLGCRAVIVKSFARIHEANLKRQGILPLWFVHGEDYENIKEDDRITLDDAYVEAGKDIHLVVSHHDGSMENIPVRHTLTEQEIQWFNAGSALEWIRQKNASLRKLP